MMKNGSVIVCPDHFHWLYAGIDFSLDGNGGPECASYLSPKHRIVETIVVLSASIIEIVWALKRVKFEDVTQLTFQKSSNSSSNGGISGYEKPVLPQRPVGKMLLLIFVCLIWGIEIGFKFSTNSLIYLLNPCHLLTISLIYLLAVGENRHSNTVKFVFRVHLHLLSGALLAIALPVVNTRFLSFEVISYWVHHLLIYFGPGYLLYLGGPFTAEPLSDISWPILSIGIGFFYHFSVLQGLALITHANLNNMLCPAVTDPFRGPYYRVWAFGHQHLLNLIHGKLFQLSTFAVIRCLSGTSWFFGRRPALKGSKTVKMNEKKQT